MLVLELNLNSFAVLTHSSTRLRQAASAVDLTVYSGEKTQQSRFSSSDNIELIFDFLVVREKTAIFNISNKIFKEVDIFWLKNMNYLFNYYYFFKYI